MALAAAVSSSVWFRFAGLAGATGVAAAAYGAHGLRPVDPHFTEVFKRANQQHMYGAALLAIAPLTKRPHVTGGLTLAGLLLFSGRCDDLMHRKIDVAFCL